MSPRAGTRAARTFAVRDRRRHELAERCRGRPRPADVLDAALDTLRVEVGFDAVFVTTTDPATTLWSGTCMIEHIPRTLCQPTLDNEFTVDDFNKFADLHRSGSPATTLERATFGRPVRSARHREVNGAAGHGPELRTTFSLDGDCWGALTLLRDRAAEDFSDAEVDFVESIRGIVAQGLRTGVLAAAPPRTEPAATPGVIMLDDDGRVVSMTDRGAALLDDLGHEPVTTAAGSLPGEAYAVSATARARAAGVPGAEAVARVRARSGQWLTLRADCAHDAGGHVASTAIVIEPSRSDEVLPLFVAAHGLTPREEAVLAELVGGRDTTGIAEALHISPHTVRDHVKSLLEKVGVRSRGALVSTMYQLHYAPGLDVTHRS